LTTTADYASARDSLLHGPAQTLGDPYRRPDQVGVVMGGAAAGTGQGVLEADPHVVSPLEPSLDHLPGGRPSCVVKPRGIYPGPVEGRIHLLGQGRTPAPVLLLVDLHQDPEAPVGEAEAQESLDIGGIEESRLDPDPPAEQRLRELRNPVLERFTEAKSGSASHRSTSHTRRSTSGSTHEAVVIPTGRPGQDRRIASRASRTVWGSRDSEPSAALGWT
jgi:hypothetical protein